MIDAHISDTELTVLLYIARYQDDLGVIAGVHYKDVCTATGICTQSLYNALYGLESKQIINIEQDQQERHSDRNIRIIGNEDRYAQGQGKNQDRESYLSLQHPIFKDPKFHQMKTNAKLMAMLFIIYVGSNQSKTNNAGHYKINKENLFTKFTALLQVKADTLRRYIGELRQFFSIYIKKNNYFVEPKKKIFVGEPQKETDADLLVGHLAGVAWRRARKIIKEKFPDMVPETLIHMVKFIKNYIHHPEVKDKLARCFLTAFKIGTETAGTINPKYIRKLLLSELAAAGVKLS